MTSTKECPPPSTLAIIAGGEEARSLHAALDIARGAGLDSARGAGLAPPRRLALAEGDAALAAVAPDADLIVIATTPAAIGLSPTRHTLALAATFGIRRAIIAVAGPVRQTSPIALGEATNSMRAFAHRLGFGEVHVLGADPRDGAGTEALLREIHHTKAAPRPLRLIPHSTAGRFTPTDRVAPNREVVLMPAAVTTRIAAIGEADAIGDAISLRLESGSPLEPGTLIAAADDRPEVADQAAANLLWLSASPLLPSRPYLIRTACATATATITQLRHRLDTDTLAEIAARTLGPGELGQVNLSFFTPLAFDRVDHCPPTARFTLHETPEGPPVAVGAFRFALRRATNIHWQALSVDKPARAAIKGQQPACLWFTGLSGSGKSTVASLIEKRLLALGRHTYTLDGDNVRHGLNRDLGFTDADRVENIRRIGEVARLMVDAGLIVIVSFISPFRAERAMARKLFSDGEFLEVFVDTPLAVCEGRDPKGLYKKARAGQLKNFTGIDSAYEAPDAPELRLAGASAPPETLADHILDEMTRRGMIGRA